MRQLFRMARLSALLLVQLGAGSASALTICISPCALIPIAGDIGPPITVIDPVDLPSISGSGISGLVLAGGDAGGPYNIAGDLVLHVPTGTLVADTLELRAGGNITIEAPVSIDVGGTIDLRAWGGTITIEAPLTINVAGTLGLCGLACEPFVTEIPGFGLGVDSFRISIHGPLTGALRIYANGDILISAAPVPEPSTALLLSLGLGALATAGRRGD